MKKALSILLAAVMVFAIALPAFAEGEHTVTFTGPSSGLITQNPAGEDIGTPYYFVKTKDGRACFVEDPNGIYYYANDGYYHTADELVEKIVPQYVSGILFAALCEATASEQGARRTAMDAASKNAAEIIDNLVLKYNRARQAVITQEITEIVSGAEAL